MSVTAWVTVSVAIITIPIPTTLSATYDLIELCQSNTVTDEHDSSEDTNDDREAHKATNLLTDKKIKINDQTKRRQRYDTWDNSFNRKIYYCM